MFPSKHIVDAAITCAKTPKRNGQGKFKVGAALYNKQKLIAVGMNYLERSIKSYNRKFVQVKGQIHAEVFCILKARQDLQGASILVVRVNKGGALRMSKPCSLCQQYLDFVGIKSTYFSDSTSIIRRLG